MTIVDKNPLRHALDAAQPTSGPGLALEAEPGSGRRYLRLPVPEPETLSRLAGALSKFLPRANED